MTTRSRWVARILTFHFVCFAWIFFRSDSFGAAWEMIGGLFTGWGEASPLVTGGVLLAIAVGIGSQYLPARVPRLVMARFSRLPVLGQATVLALALMLTSVDGPGGRGTLHLLPVLTRETVGSRGSDTTCAGIIEDVSVLRLHSHGFRHAHVALGVPRRARGHSRRGASARACPGAPSELPFGVPCR